MTHFKARNLTALLLVLILLVSMFSTTALAAEDEYITDFEAESEIIIEEEPTEELPEAEESSEEVPEIEESSEVSDAPTSGTIPGSNIQWELTDDGMLLIPAAAAAPPFPVRQISRGRRCGNRSRRSFLKIPVCSPSMTLPIGLMAAFCSQQQKSPIPRRSLARAPFMAAYR